MQHSCLTNHLASDETFYMYENVGATTTRKKIIFHTKNEIQTIATVFGR